MNENEHDPRHTYSLAEIAAKLGRPPTTISTWRAQFSSYLPTVGNGRNKRYTEAALQIFGLIARMKDANEPLEIIEATLRDNVTEIVVQSDDEPKPPLMNELLDSYQAILGVLREQAATIDQLKADNEQLMEKLEQIDQRVESRDRVLMETLREIQEKKQKGWVSKLLGR